MGISTLSTVITGDFITNIASGGSSSKPAIGVTKQPEEALSVTLQRGARGAAASIQALNSGISYINIAADYTQNMLDVVDALDTLVKKAGKGNITPTNARLYRQKFDDLAKGYEELVVGSVVKGRDLLATDQMGAILAKGGLDPERVAELQAAFKKISTFSGVEVTSTGETMASGQLFPAEDFYRAIRQATRDPEDPPQVDDGSASFSKIKIAVKEIHDKVKKNIDALNEAAGLVQKNIALVRATGFAFLDASKTVDGSQNADTVALQVRGAIRSQAAGSMGEAHNLNAMLAAGLLAVAQASK
jgi:hypothetical protein